jgi:hypothetical protein
MRRKNESSSSGNQRLQSGLEEALKHLVTILARQAAREAVAEPADE